MLSSQRNRVLNKLLGRTLELFGKDYLPGSELPPGLVLHTLWKRLHWLIRGLIRCRSIVFLDSKVRLRGKRCIKFGRGATLERGVVLDGYARRGIQVGSRTRIGAHTVVSCTSHLSRFGEGFSIGSDSGLGDYCWVGAAGGVIVGDDVIMGQFVTFHSQEHKFSDPSRLIRQQGTTEEGITIGNDCWVGARVTFLDGSHLANGCVIAAGAVVRGKFPPFSVIAGVPARVVSERTK